MATILLWRGAVLRVSAVLSALALAGAVAHGQLAITEAMSSASTNTLPDFWELTNFGTNAVDLTGYRWSDAAGLAGADTNLFNGVTIAGCESIVLIQSDKSTISEAAFLAWWGEQMPASTRIFFYTGHGLFKGGDKIGLWNPTATNEDDMVDGVDLDRARQGSTFTYDPATGLFGYYSVPGQDGAFRSALYNDIGSPGIARGQVPVRILTQPTSATVCAGLDATFTVLAGGFPRPRYQWFFNGEPLPGATRSALTLSNSQPIHAGSYFVEVRGATNTVRSLAVTLLVDTNYTAPRLAIPFPDVQVITNETARFFAAVCAYPPPVFQWRTNGMAVPGATNRSFADLECAAGFVGFVRMCEHPELAGCHERLRAAHRDAPAPVAHHRGHARAFHQLRPVFGLVRVDECRD